MNNQIPPDIIKKQLQQRSSEFKRLSLFKKEVADIEKTLKKLKR